MSKKLPIEVERTAKALYEKDNAKGTLKAPRGVAVLLTGNGHCGSLEAPATTWRDYIPEARRLLRG